MNQRNRTSDTHPAATAPRPQDARDSLASRAQEPPIPKPAPGIHTDNLPTSLTLYLTAAQRRAVLRALRRIHPNRTAALLAALDLA
ncbi:MAG: hypothetical protein D6692_12545 [Planctomycetota bacterium]|nr:MAG: hypothetical protein D6692_12545 [Planctomycetota bacterium]